ncbi:MAG: Fur family transcriptional regulator [Candidatus Bipolaricaulis sp.]|nr:Fur family transcriptional regulator [Candidatus Bipolaricaulis sp.]
MADRVSMPERLRAEGKRVTRERELLLEIIDANPHLDASEIYDRARGVNPRIGLATVYRTLRLLETMDVIDSNDLGEDHSHYEMRQDDHVHLVCSECGAVLDVAAPFDPRAFGRRRGFEIRQTRLELVGVCDDCRAKSRGEHRPDLGSGPGAGPRP